MVWLACAVVLGHVVAALLLGWGYFHRFELVRPPIGVMNLRDVVVMLGAIVVVPYLYLGLPRLMVAALLVATSLGLLYATGEPVLRRRALVWAVALVLVAADVWAASRGGTASRSFFAINNVVIVLAVVGVTNLWAQSGLKARDTAVLGGLLAVYDVVATSVLPLTDELIARLGNLPFAPLLAWPAGGAGVLSLGLGDTLLATVFPLVMGKAFGRGAGWWALALGLAVVAGLLVTAPLGLLAGTFPVMVVLGPLMVGQYAWWRRRRAERTTWQFLAAERVQRRTAPVG